MIFIFLGRAMISPDTPYVAQDGQLKVVPQPPEWGCTGAPVCLATWIVDSEDQEDQVVASASDHLSNMKTARLTMQLPFTWIVYLAGHDRVARQLSRK